ncbi:putative leader peptide [Streptomyces sp. NPDC049097]|uniref:putative leader peptide n=1 Tax=unclassified Streptomyces TaxID=2593676 RepID=UPI00342AA24D
MGADFCHDPHQPGRKTRDLWGGRAAMRTLSRAGRLLPLLTSRRHIDLGRTSSAICRPV